MSVIMSFSGVGGGGGGGGGGGSVSGGATGGLGGGGASAIPGTSGIQTAEILYQDNDCIMTPSDTTSTLPPPHMDTPGMNPSPSMSQDPLHFPSTSPTTPDQSSSGGSVGGSGGGRRRRRTPPKAKFDINDNSLYSVYCFFKSLLSASTASTVAIDNKIEQAMDLVKSHLMFAVREEVEVLKEKITELLDRISQLEYENMVLRQYATQEALQKIQQHHSSNT